MRHDKRDQLREAGRAKNGRAAAPAARPHWAKVWCRKCAIPVLAGTIAVTSVFGTGIAVLAVSPVKAAAAQQVTYKLVKQGESIVTAGVRQIDYGWVPSDPKKTTEEIHVLQVDLTNPYVQLNAMSGRGGSVTSGQSVTAMATETKAVAGVNGDVFNTASTSEGAPIGAQITSGKLVTSTSQKTGMYAFAVTKDRKPVIDMFSFEGSVTAADGSVFPLAGINKSAYMTEPDNSYSHVNALYIYTSAWTAPQRPANSSTTPTEALVVDGVVQQIVPGQEIAGPIPDNGYILRGHGDAAKFITDHLKVGDKVATSYTLKSLTTGQSFDPSSFQMMVSGHTILVDGGKAAPFSRDIRGVSGSANAARTAVGYSKDGKTVYLVTVEQYAGRDGLKLADLQQVLIQLGVWKAVNMDGGGSTTMVARPLGDFNVQLVHPTKFGTTQRQVANGIGVYTTAPQGEIKGIAASGPKTLFIGQQAAYTLKAYDTYYNPLDPSGLKPTWSLSDAIGELQNGQLLAKRAGTAKLTVKAGQASDTIDLEVIGQAQIQQLTIRPSTTLLAPGGVISVPVKARLSDGRELDVPASSVSWEFRGFTATAEGGKLTIGNVQDNIPYGYAIARYDGYSTMIVLAPGTEKPLEDFESGTAAVSFQGTPSQTQGSASIVTGVPGRESGKVLDLAYDFTAGSGNHYAYAVLNGGKGIDIPGKPGAMTVDVLGDGSRNWLRAEFADAKGKPVYVTLADTIDWTGWRTLRVDLGAAGLTYPARLTKLYVVDLEQDQDEREPQGEVALDNLKLQYPPAVATPKPAQIVLTMGKAQAVIDGRNVKLDAAPLNLNGTNYVPLRFVADALGGQAEWDGQQKKVTVLRGDTMLELWVGRPDLNRNGTREQSPASPIIRNGRTLVPVRVVSEQLGQQVDWDGGKRTITIH